MTIHAEGRFPVAQPSRSIQDASQSDLYFEGESESTGSWHRDRIRQIDLASAEVSSVAVSDV